MQVQSWRHWPSGDTVVRVSFTGLGGILHSCSLRELGLSCWCGSQPPAGVGRREWDGNPGMGIRWLVSLNLNTCVVKTGGISRGTVTTVLTIVFFSGENYWGPLRARHSQPGMFLLCGLYWEPLLFCPVAGPLCTIQLCQSLGGVNLKWVFHVVPRKVGKRFVHPFSYSREGNSF